MTGVSGFIGARLARRLVVAGVAEIRALMRPSSSRELIADLPLVPVLGDLEGGAELEPALEGVDLVFHLAGLTRARSLAEFRRVNAEGTARLAAAAARAGVGRFIHTSSLAAVGPNPVGVATLDEDAPCRPVTWYGQSKMESEERLVDAIGEVPWTIVRPPGVYGPGERDFLTMFRMVSRRFAPILGLRPKAYSFVYSEDLIEGMLRLGLAPGAERGRYFVAAPGVHSDAEMLGYIEAALGRRALKPRLPHLLAGGLAALNDLVAPLMKRPPLLSGQKMRELRPERWVVDCSRLERDTGFVCPTGLAEGIRLTAAWYRDQGWI
ncbi:MAG: NAD-dependent epimerase/dehydratase family protein [Planctomycetes bacterium]|nr:NAD-dependent epimerase/dehydratase family protein [Planctomycetota bacterium]